MSHYVNVFGTQASRSEVMAVRLPRLAAVRRKSLRLIVCLGIDCFMAFSFARSFRRFAQLSDSQPFCLWRRIVLYIRVKKSHRTLHSHPKIVIEIAQQLPMLLIASSDKRWYHLTRYRVRSAQLGFPRRLKMWHSAPAWPRNR